MGTGENAFRHSSRAQDNLKRPKSVGILLVIWFLAIGSLLGIHYSLKKKPRLNKAEITKIEAMFKSLSDEQRISIKYFEGGILKSASGELSVVDSGLEENEMRAKGLSVKKIEFVVDDPLFLERQMMVGETSKRLNNAEKHLVMDRHAVILYRDGAYYLVYDPEIYRE